MISQSRTAGPVRARRSPIRLRARLAAALVVIAGCSDVTGPLPREGAPDELEFSMGGYGVGSTSVKLRGQEVLVTRVPWDYQPGVRIDSVRAVPTAEDWANFWVAAEQAGVRRWRREYMAEGVVDGVGWSLRLSADGVVVRSQGSNAFPDRRGREHEMHEPAEFSAFMDAIGALAGQEF